MHDHDIGRKIGLECHDNLTGQCNLRHKHNDLPAGCPHAAGQLDIHLCLATAGNALEQKALILVGCPHRLHRSQCRLLVVGKLHRLTLDGNRTITVTQDPPLTDLYQPGLRQMPDGSRRYLPLFQASHRQCPLRRGRQQFQQLQLSFTALVVRLKLRCHGSGQHDKFLIAGIIPLLRRIFPDEYMILHEFGQDIRQAVPIVRQCPADLGLPAWTFGQQVPVDCLIHRHPQQDMVMLAFIGGILNRDLEAAFARHEKAHHLSQ